MFVGYTCQPVGGALLWGSVVGDTPVVDYPYVAFFLAHLSSAHWYLCVARGTTWSLIVSFLLAVTRKVTGLSAEKACEDFPLSVLLDGSPWISSFLTSSYVLFVSVSSWKEIVCFSYPGSRPSWGSVHGVWVPLRVPPLIAKRPPGSNGWHFLRFETIGPVSHVNVHPLLVDCC
jgi:hypothetical protein